MQRLGLEQQHRPLASRRPGFLASWCPDVLASWRPGVLASCAATRKKEKPPRREAKKKPYPPSAQRESRSDALAGVRRSRRRFLLRKEQKKPAASYSRTGESRTTLGDGALNFRVRNGNGCDNSSMATGKKPFSWELKRLTTHNEMRGIDLTSCEVLKYEL